MNINDMSDEEKSVMLAKAMGWEDVTLWLEGESSPGWLMAENELIEVLNLYDPAFMALAWRVLNWAMHQGPEESPATPGLTIYSWSPKIYAYLRQSHWVGVSKLFLYSMPPAAAQRLWLDKILELGLEAGLVPSASSGQDEVSI